MRWICGLTLAALAAAHASAAEVLHVDEDAAPGGDGLSWATAFDDLQDALDVAATPGEDVCEIRIAEGTYRPDRGTGDRSLSFMLTDGVTLLGGFAGAGEPDPDVRDPDVYVSILSGDLDGDDLPGFVNVGDNARTVVYANELSVAATLDGIAITSGNANSSSGLNGWGAGMMLFNANVVLRDCALTSNRANRAGAAIYSDLESNVLIEQCVIADNLVFGSSGPGGAVDNHATMTLLSCTLERNVTALDGGAFTNFNTSAYADVIDCVFADNAAENGAAANLFWGTTNFVGCTFSNNVAGAEGGAVRTIGPAGTLHIDTCSFTDNVAQTGGALHVDIEASIEDSSFSGNSSADGGAICAAGTSPMTIDECSFTANTTTGNGGAILNAGPLTICDCTLTDNAATLDGGAIFDLSAAGLTIERSHVEANTCGNVGGGVCLTTGVPVVSGCVFASNAAECWGGGLYAISCTPCIIGNDFVSNDAGEYGGGVTNVGTIMWIDDCTFASNNADFGGGGVHNADGAELSIRRSTLQENTASFEGGGILNAASTATVGNGWFLANGALALGGGLSNTLGATASVVNSVFTGNTSGLLGGAIACSDGADCAIANCTIATNAADLEAGGLAVLLDGSASVSNTVLWLNTDAGGASEEAQVSAGTAMTFSIDYSCVQGWSGALGGVGNIGDDPMLLDPTGGDGIAGTDDDDLRVTGGSPCIDAADNTAVPGDALDLDDDGDVAETTPFDIADRPRFVDDPSMPDTGIGPPPIADMGAFEFDGDVVHFVGPAGGSWFDPTHWSGGEVPTANSDLVITAPVTVDQPGAVARDVIVVDAGAISIDSGSLTAVSIAVDRGGLLQLDGSALLEIADLAVTSGTLDWISGTIDVGSTLVHSMALTIGDGGEATLLLTGATVFAPSLLVETLGELRGDGVLDAPVVTNRGMVRPGSSLGTLALTGCFVQDAGATLVIEIRELSSGLRDVLLVDDDVTLAGTLVVEREEPFVYELATSARIIETETVFGIFDAVVWPDVEGLVELQLLYDADGVDVRSTVPTPRLFVDANASGGVGTTWPSAFADLQVALENAIALPGEVTEIWVASGTYIPTARSEPGTPRTETFFLVNGVALYGGFAGDESELDERDVIANATVLSGDLAGDDGPNFLNNFENAYHVVRGVGVDDQTRLDGFTISGGNADESQTNPDGRGAGLFLEDSFAEVNGCTFTSNSATQGGGMFLSHTAATVVACTFHANRAEYGAGAQTDSDDGVFADCVFSENMADFAGALELGRGVTTAINCQFSDNTALNTGALEVVSGTHLVTLCTFSNNAAVREGGALQCRGALTTTVVSACTFSGNSVDEGGGAAFADSTTVTFSSCVFVGNTAETEGGGAVRLERTDAAFFSCVLAGNTAPNGAGIHSYESAPTLTGCTVFSNDAFTDGGGLFAEERSQVRIDGSILWGNFAGPGPPDEPAQVTISGDTQLQIDHSCVDGWTGVLGGSGNIGNDPRFVDEAGPDGVPGTLDDDLHLQPSSPCVNTGWRQADPIDAAVDVDGEPRIQHCRMDMGADESRHVAVLDCNGNGIHDDCDLLSGFSLDCNGNGTPDECDIASGLSGDCNGDGVPNECEVVEQFTANSGDLSPIGDSTPQNFTIFDPDPARSDVFLALTISADIGETHERVIVSVNDVLLGEVFTAIGLDCGDPPNSDWLRVDMDTWNTAVGDLDAVIELTTTGVDDDDCDDASFVSVEISFDVSSDLDGDGNGVPDECDCLADCAMPADGVVGIADLLAIVAAWGQAGSSCDLNGDGTVDVQDMVIVLGAWGPCR